MTTLSLRQLWAHKRRLLSTVAAVTIGVAFLAGTLVLGDTMRATFDDLFNRSTAGVDAYVRPVVKADDDQPMRGATLLDAAVLDHVRAVDGARAVEPVV